MVRNNKRKIILIILFFMIVIISFIIIVLYNTKTNIQIYNFDSKTVNTSGEQIINSWNISESGRDNVIATLYEDGKLIISGSGNIKEWDINDTSEWHEQEVAEKVKKVIIEDGIKEIGKYAFANCTNLINVEIPSSITKIGSQIHYIINGEVDKDEQLEYTVFANCKNLLNINVDENSEKYSSINGVLFNKDQTEIEYYPNGKKEQTYIIPETVEEIKSNAFENCVNLVNIIINEGTKKINYNAFKNCTSITEIEIPSSVYWIGSSRIVMSSMRTYYYKCLSI